MGIYDYRKELTSDIRKALEENLISGRIRTLSDEEMNPEEMRLASLLLGKKDGPEARVKGNIGLLSSLIREKPSLLPGGPEEVGTWILEGDFAAIDETIRTGLFHECFARALDEVRKNPPLPKPGTLRILSGVVTFLDGKLPGAEALEILNGRSGSMLYTGSYRLIFWPGEMEGGMGQLMKILAGITAGIENGSVLVEENGKKKAVLFTGGGWHTFSVADRPDAESKEEDNETD